MMTTEERQERINGLITRGQEIQERLVPLWSEYRRWLMEIRNDFQYSIPPREQLTTPDVGYLIDALAERNEFLDRVDSLGNS